MTKANRIALIDGDIIVYRVGFAADDVNWSLCRARVDKFMADLLVNTKADDYFGYLTDGANNFRNKIATTAPYKGTRSQKKPKFYSDIRQYLWEDYAFEVQTEQEADDAIAIKNHELIMEQESDIVICSIDKDLNQIPGFHYNFVRNDFTYISAVEASHSFYQQMLEGDRVDNVPGIVGCGPVLAKRILMYATIYAMPHRVAAAYVTLNPSSWDIQQNKEYFLEQGSLLYLRRTPQDKFNPDVDDLFSEEALKISTKVLEEILEATKRKSKRKDSTEVRKGPDSNPAEP